MTTRYWDKSERDEDATMAERDLENEWYEAQTARCTCPLTTYRDTECPLHGDEADAANAPSVAVDLSHKPLEPCADCGVDTATYYHLSNCPHNQSDEEFAGVGTAERFA